MMIFGMTTSTFTLAHVLLSVVESARDSSSCSGCWPGNGSTD